MAQEYIMMGKTADTMLRIRQPDTGLGYSFETTYTADSGRVQAGDNVVSPMFTVEQLSYSASDLTVNEMHRILQIVAKGSIFWLRYLSPYYGEWRTDEFQVGKGSLSIGRINEASERYDSLSFNMQGVHPL